MLMHTNTKNILREINARSLVRERKNKRARGATARSPIYLTRIRHGRLKRFSRVRVICETKTAAHNAAKEACNLSFLPVIRSETAIVKLVAAKIKVSIMTFVESLYRIIGYEIKCFSAIRWKMSWSAQ